MTNDMDWLTSDEDERKKFLDDPMAHFTYTVQGYRDMTEMIRSVNSDKSIMKIPAYLSIYMAVGENDPMNVHIQKLIQKYKNIPIEDLTFHIFKGQRHALLFEKEKKKVYQSILDWLDERTYL